ncbi:helix-turn-helix transcriptional regulator [Bacillus mesophilum]|uniref:Helix-turn-helix transcriptional regulator n=1 Tax=Bacillus mesophilum TaxID=1071718 RepID=A0A7V7UVK0_9BACI|nr:helix-turn-helix transcriptional regulator [Bacillus mesophilum]KAB2332856.1 helix-turn-helix transcriptional regulator [Bacillus mesophilum]
MHNKIYTPDEVAALLKISKHTVYELIKRGELASFKVGKKMRIEERELNRLKTGAMSAPVKQSQSIQLRLAGSHDFLVESLVQYVSKEDLDISIQPSYIGSLEGLMELYKGRCDIAAVHLLEPVSKMYNLPFIHQLFVHEKITVMRLAAREQGLIAAAGNPHNIKGIKDLERNNLVFVNRQKGSGTRFLFDTILADKKINPVAINGYEHEEWTHLSAASHISSGNADAAFGIKTAASRLNLDFIPIAVEQFDLVFKWTQKNENALQHIVDVLELTSFREHVDALAGYDGSQFGCITYDSR